jgi:chromosome partitioning protein
MKTIVVTSQKGGSGKTTLAAHLAVEAERAGDGPAWLIDTDKQGTLSLWHERRESDTPQRAEVSFARLSEGLKTLANSGGAYCFIDTPPTISEQSAAVLGLADLVLIPVRPSPADLWAVSETVALVKEAERSFLFVITQAKAQASITAQSIAALSEHGRVARSFIADRVSYAVAMTGGRTAPELGPKAAAAEEIAGIWRDVKSCFHERLKIEKRVRSVANG